MKMNTENKNELQGLNIYKDNKGRTIYYNPIKKQGYFINHEYLKAFQITRYRFVIPLIAFILIYSFIDNTIISIAIAAISYIVLALRLYISILPKLSPVPNYKPEQKISYVQRISEQETSKIILKAILYLAFGILTFINAFVAHYELYLIIISGIIAIVAIGVAFCHLLGFIQHTRTNKTK